MHTSGWNVAQCPRNDVVGTHGPKAVMNARIVFVAECVHTQPLLLLGGVYRSRPGTHVLPAFWCFYFATSPCRANGRNTFIGSCFRRVHRTDNDGHNGKHRDNNRKHDYYSAAICGGSRNGSISRNGGRRIGHEVVLNGLEC